MTNYEKIKNMSIEEMANIKVCPYTKPKCKKMYKCLTNATCKDCRLNWLRKEHRK